MPIISHEVEETVEAVTRPVIFAVARDLLQRTGLSLETDIYLNKGDSQARTLNTGIRETDSEAQFDQGEKIKVSMEEEFMDDGMLERTIPDPNTNEAFVDPELGVWIKPIYHNVEIILNVEMYFNSESAAHNWVNGIRRRVGNGRQHQKHTAAYHFAIPKVMMNILAELYKLRENRAGYGDTFGTWLKANFSELVTVMTNQAGSSSNFSVSEKQTGFNGWYSFEKPPVAVQNTQQWSASFSYTFQYHKPTAFAMGYPLMIHNQLVPSALRLRGENFNMLVDPNHADYTKSRFMRLDGATIPGQSICGVSIPEWDEWLPERVRSHYSTLLRLMMMVGDDPRELFNLDSMGTVQLDPLLREFMVKNHDKLTKTYQNPFHIALYRDGLPLHEDAIHVDENLFVRATFDLDPRHHYHIWIGCVNDLSMLSERATDELIIHGETAKQVIRVVDSKFDVDSINILDDDSISLPRWNVVKTGLRETNRRYNTRAESNTLTVGQFAVTAQNYGRE